MKRKIVLDEITDVEKKKARLQESMNDLIKDADKLAFEAETKNDLKLLERSNAGFYPSTFLHLVNGSENSILY